MLTVPTARSADLGPVSPTANRLTSRPLSKQVGSGEVLSPHPAAATSTPGIVGRPFRARVTGPRGQARFEHERQDPQDRSRWRPVPASGGSGRPAVECTLETWTTRPLTLACTARCRSRARSGLKTVPRGCDLGSGQRDCRPPPLVIFSWGSPAEIQGTFMPTREPVENHRR